MVYTTIGIQGTCGLCSKLANMLRKYESAQSDYHRFNEDAARQATAEMKYKEMYDLAAQIKRLREERMARQNRTANVNFQVPSSGVNIEWAHRLGYANYFGTQIPPRKQSASSYWSVPEQQDFVKYIDHFGRDFAAIASHMGTKTQTMIRNHFHRQIDSGSRPDLEEAADRADERRVRGEHIGAPHAPTPVVRRKYEPVAHRADRSPQRTVESATPTKVNAGDVLDMLGTLEKSSKTKCPLIVAFQNTTISRDETANEDTKNARKLRNAFAPMERCSVDSRRISTAESRSRGVKARADLPTELPIKGIDFGLDFKGVAIAAPGPHLQDSRSSNSEYEDYSSDDSYVLSRNESRIGPASQTNRGAP